MKKILVCDDDRAMRNTILMALKRCGYELIEAENGALGFEAARRHLPDLVISDVDMPVWSGNELLKALRSHPATAAIPFIFMTGKPDKVSMRLGMFLGADDYLPKPFILSELVSAVKGRLQRHQQLAALADAKLVELRATLGRNLPHELLTPLTSILGVTQVLKEEYDALPPGEIYNMAVVIDHSGQLLLRLINNYLLFLDLESLAQDPALVQALRSDRLACPGKSAQAAALGVAQKYSRDTDLAVEGSESPIAISERYFRKIVEELADNAFKFSRPGTPVQVATTVTSAEFTLAIRDEGLGLTPEQIAQVGAYRQFDRQRHEQQGLGFGMAFVHRLVELHGGRFWIESPNPQSTLEAPGSTFRIALPLAAGIVLQAHGFTAPA